jgi:glucose/arabinose dehydrogenase
MIDAAPQAGQGTGTAPVLPPPYATKSNENFSSVTPFASGKMPHVPAGFVVSRFAIGLDSPRNAFVLPNGDVLVAEAKTGEKYNDVHYRDRGANRIALLRYTDGDGVVDQRWIFMSNLRQPYGMALVEPKLYIADTEGIVRVTYQAGKTPVSSEQPRQRIATFVPSGYNNHWTRNIIASPDGRYLYVAIGSASNAGENGLTEEKRRANILRLDLNNGGKESVYAWGIRNPVGLAYDPAGKLWTVVNERDHLGDNLVPDYIVQPEQGGFYWWPWFYWGQDEDPRLKGQRHDLKAHSLTPDYALGPHVAALGIEFGTNTRFASPWRQGAFVARHGSWNRRQLSGYDVIFVPFTNGRPSGAPQPFLTGFIARDKEVHGRPRAIATARDGSLLVTDDAGGTVGRVAAK